MGQLGENFLQHKINNFLIVMTGILLEKFAPGVAPATSCDELLPGSEEGLAPRVAPTSSCDELLPGTEEGLAPRVAPTPSCDELLPGSEEGLAPRVDTEKFDDVILK